MADAAPFMAVDVIGTIITVLVKGIACGICAGLMYLLLGKKYSTVGVIAAAITCPVVNTGVFLIGCRLFFFEAIAAWGQELGFESTVAYMFLGLAGVNFLVELAVNLLLAPVIVRLIRIGQKT